MPSLGYLAYIIGVVLLLVALFAILGVIHVAWVTFAVAGVILIAVGYLLSRGPRSGARL